MRRARLVGFPMAIRIALPFSLIALLLGGLALLCLASCGPTEVADPRRRERIVSIEGAALSRFLVHTAKLEGTPAATLSKSLLARAEGCSELYGHFDASATREAGPFAIDAHALACRADDTTASTASTATDTTKRTTRGDDEWAAFAREQRGRADGFLSWPIGDDGSVALRIDVDSGGGLSIEGDLLPPSQPGVLALFLPALAAPAAPVLEPSTALVHLRVRPEGGIGLSDWMPSGGQADRLFALKGRLLEGALLSGTWELAFLPPADGGAMPLAVAALHHRVASALEEALDEALSQLEATWPIRRTPRRFTLASGASVEGGCFRELPLLPELSPCWVVTPEAFVIGYRAEALDRALSAPAVSSPAPEAARVAETEDPRDDARSGGRLDLYLDRVQRVDAQLLAGADATSVGDLFAKLELRWRAQPDGRVAIRARLGAKP